MDEVTRRDSVKLAAAGVVALGASAVLAQEKKDRPEKVRGSAKMVEELLGHRTVIDKDELRSLLTAIDQQGVRIVDWCQYGQPGIDGVCGKIEVAPKGAGDLVRDLFRFKRIRPELEVFPYGIPVIDRLLIELRIGRVPRG